MTTESQEFEKLNARIQRLVCDRGLDVTWDAQVPDPDLPATNRQIDILISDGICKTSVECRIRKGAQDVMWIEELAGRKQSLGLDGMIAISYGGFTRLAKIKAKRFGIALYDYERLSDEEIQSWGGSAIVEAVFVVFTKLKITAGVPNSSVSKLAPNPLFMCNGVDGCGAVMAQIASDVAGTPHAEMTKSLTAGGFTVDGIPASLLICEFSGMLLTQKATCTTVEMVGDPDTPAVARGVSVQRFDTTVSELIVSDDGAHLIVDVSRINPPADSLWYETRVVFPAVTQVATYGLVGNRRITVPATLVEVIIAATQ